MPLGNPMGYMTGMGGFNPMMLQKLMGGGFSGGMSQGGGMPQSLGMPQAPPNPMGMMNAAIQPGFDRMQNQGLGNTMMDQNQGGMRSAGNMIRRQR